MIRLVVTDMDGTLLDSRKRVPEDFPGWVEAHPQILTAIASGRQYATLYEGFPEGIRDRLVYIAENGGLVMEGRQVLYRFLMEKDDLRRCLETVRSIPGLTPILCGVRSAYMVRAKEAVDAQARMYYRRMVYTEDLDACIDADEIMKIAVYAEQDRAEEDAPALDGVSPRVRPVVSGPDWIDLSGRDTNKGAALRTIQIEHGIAWEETMGFGDYMNDLELLGQCGESYAMANACEGILRAARYRTASNDEDGVMAVLRRL